MVFGRRKWWGVGRGHVNVSSVAEAVSYLQHVAKTIIDAIIGLSFDDSPNNPATATHFDILTGDGQDDHLLESHNCIPFLIKLLRPVSSTAIEDKGRKIGFKVLASYTIGT